MNLGAITVILSLSLISQTAQQSPATRSATQHNEPKPDKFATRQDQVTSSKQRALGLLEELFGQTRSFAGAGPYDLVKVSLIQADIADLLWDYNEPRARSLFETALKTAQTIRPNQRTPMVARHLEVEQEIIQYALGRDARFAEELVATALKASETARSKGTDLDWAFRSEQATLLSQIAKSVAAANPQRAGELVRTSFNGWFGPDQVVALNALRLQAPALADEIFLYALTVLRKKPTNQSNKFDILAPYVFPEIKSPTGADIRKAGGSSVQPESDPAVKRAFLEFVYETFMAQPVSSHTGESNAFGDAAFDSFAMRRLLPRFDEILPDKAPAIRARVNEIIKTIKKSGRQDMADREGELWEQLFRKNVDQLVSQAEAAKDQTERDHFYEEAIGLLLYRDSDVGRAMALLARMSDGPSKTHLIRLVGESGARTAIAEGDAERAYLYSREFQEPELQADLLTRTAKVFLNTGNIERGRVVWTEARKIAKAEQASGWPYTLLELAAVAAQISPELGFQALKEAIDVINAVGATNVMSSGGRQRIGFNGRFDFDETFSLLAPADFERSLQLAKSIRVSELATLAQLSVCKGILRTRT